MPELIMAGKVYKAVPPLYGIKMGKKKRYFTDKIDFTKYLQSAFSRNNNITSTSNIKLTSNEITELFVKNIDYVYELEIVANTYAIDPILLEFILNRHDLDYKTFKKDVEKAYRFLKVRIENGITIIEGLVDSRYHTIFLNSRLLDSCKKILSIIDNNITKVYKLNDRVVTIYTLMKTFENSMPTGITRYKGLGEQNPEELGESTLHPDSDRCLIRYTIDDIKKEIETIRYMESNKADLLKNIVVTRQDIE